MTSLRMQSLNWAHLRNGRQAILAVGRLIEPMLSWPRNCLYTSTLSMQAVHAQPARPAARTYTNVTTRGRGRPRPRPAGAGSAQAI